MGFKLSSTAPKLPEITLGERISGLYTDYKQGKINEDKLFAGIDTLSKWQIDNIVNSESEYSTDGNVYYISNSGDDSNDGLSPETAWATLAKLDSLEEGFLKPGDTVLFERGGLFRGSVFCVSGVTYSAYGKGDKPIICGSARNYADQSLWLETDVPNVYKYDGTLNNVGIILFNDTRELGNYNEILGDLKVIGREGFESYHNLYGDLQFVSDLKTNELYIYSSEGNPGSRFESIEIGINGRIFGVKYPYYIIGLNDVIIDNIRMRICGGHGVGIGTSNNVTVRNCVCDYIGGSVIRTVGFEHAQNRYGNAIELYGGCNGFYVFNNWCYQAYDTGVTNQYNAGADKSNCFMDNVQFIGNIIEYCHWSIEYYNYDFDAAEQHVYDEYILDNICRMNGFGWGTIYDHRKEHDCAIECWGLTGNTKDFVIGNNVIDRVRGRMFDLVGKGHESVELNENIYIFSDNVPFGRFVEHDKFYFMEQGAEYLVRDVMGDKTSHVLFDYNKELPNYTPNKK